MQVPILKENILSVIFFFEEQTMLEVRIMDASYQKLGLSDLLEQDLSSYEFYHSLPADVQKKIEEKDIGSFRELQEAANKLR